MSNRYSTGKRDDNEEALLEVARLCGYKSFDELAKTPLADGEVLVGFWQQASEKDGHDLNFWDCHGMFSVEVKNPDVPPSKRQLTPSEIVFRDLCQLLGRPWYKIETEQEMFELLQKRKKNGMVKWDR